MRRLRAGLFAAALIVLMVAPRVIAGIGGVLPGGSQASALNPVWFGATLPTLPQQFSTAMPASLSCANTNAGSCFTPTTGAQLQTDLNTAAADTGSNGDIIECAAGTTYTASQFVLPQRASGSSGVIYLISSDAPEIGGSGLPAAGTHVWADWPPQSAPAFSNAAGTLPAGTYYYGVTSTTASGESTVDPILSITTTASGEVTITWTAQTNATGYKVYRSVNPDLSSAVYFTVPGGASTSFVDTGGAGTLGQPPNVNTTVDVAAMCSLRSSGTSGQAVIARGTSATQYRLVGLDVEMLDSNSSASGNINYYTINFDNNDTSLSTLASYITIDRCYVLGSPSYGVRHAIDLDGDYMAVVESFVNNIPLSEREDGDSNAILVINSVGPYRINDNYLEANGETTLFGGSDTALPSPAIPSNIVVTNNHYYKPLAIFNGTTSSTSNQVTVNSVSYGVLQVGMNLTGSSGGTITGIAGNTLTLAANYPSTGTASLVASPFGKNMVEFKTGDDILFQHNYLENAGAHGQAGSAFVLTVRDQSGGNPWYALTDVTIQDNVFTNAAYGGTNWLLQDNSVADPGAYNTQPAFRILFRNNLIIESYTLPGGGGKMVGINTNGPDASTSIVLDHDTFISTGVVVPDMFVMATASGAVNYLKNFVISNCIFDETTYGFTTPGQTNSYSVAFAKFISGGLQTINNVFTGTSWDSSIPSGNFDASAETNVGYVDYGSVNVASGYALTSASPYHAAGISGLNLPYTSSGTPDGTDIGVNIANLPVN